MARVMYIDCFSGAAGDMLLGAFIDAGLPLDGLRAALGSLGVAHELRVSTVTRTGITATHIDVISDDEHVDARHPHTHPHEPEHSHGHSHAHGHHHSSSHAHEANGHRSLKEIARLIDGSGLSAAGKTRAKALFRRLGEVEAAIHGMSLDEVHLHEVGAVDSIIDIVGAVYALEWFGIDDIVSSPLNVGSGTVRIAHGTFPVPAPATLKLLTGVPVYSAGPTTELLTPTGALLISDYARSYGTMPRMTVERVGYGAGTKDFVSTPNVVRILIGERAPDVTSAPSSSPTAAGETVTKIECEIDDMNPQLFGPATDRLFEAGALDVFLTAVQMKKGRPGTLVTVLAAESARRAVCDVLFRETTTIGVRFERMEREILDRRWVEVDTSGGVVRIKVSSRDGQVLNAIPEFDDCMRIAATSGRPLKAVQAEAVQAWWAWSASNPR